MGLLNGRPPHRFTELDDPTLYQIARLTSSALQALGFGVDGLVPLIRELVRRLESTGQTIDEVMAEYRAGLPEWVKYPDDEVMWLHQMMEKLEAMKLGERG